jgi:type III secretion protein J
VTRSAAPSKLAGAVALVASLSSAACAVSVAGELDEARANRIVALLDANGIAAEKSADPAQPGHFRVEVSGEEASAALGILADEGPSARDTPGVLDALGTSSLVPSPQAEHERLLAGVAGDLKRSLEGLDGVLSARVHLAARRPDPLAVTDESAGTPPTASVLIRHRGATVPLREDEVRRLVAFAVPGLEPERVAVVYSQALPARTGRELVRVGPISMTRAAARKVRAAVLLVLTVNIALAVSLVALWARLRRLRAGASELPKPRATR